MIKFTKVVVFVAVLGLLTSFAYAGPDDTARPESIGIEIANLE